MASARGGRRKNLMDRERVIDSSGITTTSTIERTEEALRMHMHLSPSANHPRSVHREKRSPRGGEDPSPLPPRRAGRIFFQRLEERGQVTFGGRRDKTRLSDTTSTGRETPLAFHY